MFPFHPNNGMVQLSPSPMKGIEHYTYSLQEIIGRGFSSIVYKGTNTRTGEPVAIKVQKIQRKQVVEQRALQEQIQNMVLTNEIETLKKLKSENILKLYDVFHTVNNSYIITEYCDKGDLGTYLKKSGALNEIEAIKVLKHVINGLKELQRHGIAHRDLKPDNILIKDGIPKIADFGFAKSIEKITQNRGKEFNVGTPLYMSPETLTRNEYSDKTDMWALGVMFYELIFGVLPWNATTEQELLQQIFANNITFPFAISDNAKDLIIRTISIDPSTRMKLNDILAHPLIRNQEQIKRISTQNNMTNQYEKGLIHPKSARRYDEQNSAKDIQKDMAIGNIYVQGDTGKDFIHPNPQSPSQTKDFSNNAIVRCDNVLTAYEELCKFLRKVYFSLDTPQNFTSPFLNSKLRYITVKNIMVILTKIKEQVDDEKALKNPLKLESWKSFVEQPQCIRHRSTIREMFSQNQKLHQSVFDELSSNEGFIGELNFDKNFDTIFHNNFFQYPSFYIIALKILKDGVRELNHNLVLRLKPEMILTDEGGSKLTTLELLLSYLEMLQLLQKTLFDPHQFSKETRLKNLMETSKITNHNQYSQIRQKIKMVTSND